MQERRTTETRSDVEPGGERPERSGSDALAGRVEALAWAVVRAINKGPVGRRRQLREMAVQLLREEVDLTEVAAPVSGVTGGRFNPFGIAIPLSLAGMVTVILFPPVGVLLFGTALFMMVWGVLAVLLARR